VLFQETNGISVTTLMASFVLLRLAEYSPLDETDAERRGLPVEGRSANHFELAYTKFEFLIDFGQAYDNSEHALLHTRIIMTPSSAKTLSNMLQQLIRQYEAEVGEIEERTV
jgi:hypothetical protein